MKFFEIVSMPDHVIINLTGCAEVTDRKGLIELNSVGPVLDLPVTRYPLAVLRRVISVAVVAFQRQPLGEGWSHVSKEVFKRRFPTVANFNASIPVPMKFSCIGIVATLKHRVISIVKRRSTHAVGGVVFRGTDSGRRSFAGHYLPEASTIGGDALAKVGRIDPGSGSACAGTEPMCAWTSFARGAWNRLVRAGDGPVVESLVC